MKEVLKTQRRQQGGVEDEEEKSFLQKYVSLVCVCVCADDVMNVVGVGPIHSC